MKTNQLMDSNLLVLEGLPVTAYTVAPTQTTNGTEVADANFATVIGSFAAPEDDALAGVRKMINDVDFAFGAAGYTAPVDVVAIGIKDEADNALYWVAYETTVPAGEILRVPAGEFTVREG